MQLVREIVLESPSMKASLPNLGIGMIIASYHVGYNMYSLKVLLNRPNNSFWELPGEISFGMEYCHFLGQSYSRVVWKFYCSPTEE